MTTIHYPLVTSSIGTTAVEAKRGVGISKDTPRLESMGSGRASAESSPSWNNENEDSNSCRSDTKDDDVVVDPIAFCKSQQALNHAYKVRREKYHQTPLAARVTTGKNLQNLSILAVRKAEFC